MDIKVKPGNYVVAVSGGVDSVSLLHVLKTRPGLELLVAHFDHGIRADSAEDRRFVQELAASYELPFAYEEGNLGSGASEATARQARYAFLRRVQHKNGSGAIITAHHQDDVLETAIINMLRGTGRKGLTSLANRPGTSRPLLAIPKKELVEYARTNGIKWREDPTNKDLSYLRNYVRHRILPRFSQSDRANLLEILDKSAANNQELDEALAKVLAGQARGSIERAWFSQLPHKVAREVMAAWLRSQMVNGFDRKTLERLVIAAKVAPAGKVFPVKASVDIKVGNDYLALAEAER